MVPAPSFALDAWKESCALGIVRPERLCHVRWLDHRCLEHLAGAFALCGERVGHPHLSRLVQAANDACSAEPVFEFLPLALTH